MNPREIRDAVASGEMSPQEAAVAFQSMRERSIEPSMPVGRPKREFLPSPNSMITRVQANDARALREVRKNLAQQIENRAAEHAYQRAYVEESTRHMMALPAVALLGLVDGAAEAVGYGISELAETLSYSVTRTARRFMEGIQRGRHG